MKRMLTIILLAVLLTGCGSQSEQVDKAMVFREKLLQGQGCSFDVTITADYMETLYTFSMNCSTDASGNLTFTVKEPSTIAGISGIISSDGGKLTFDDQVLAFEEMADGQISPVYAPWVFVNTLRSGYINSCGEAEDGFRICIDDSYAEEALQLDIWTDHDVLPTAAEISWKGRRILTLEISNFTIL